MSHAAANARASILRISSGTTATIGTGFFIDRHGTVLTCAHVAEAALAAGQATATDARGRSLQFGHEQVTMLVGDLAVIALGCGDADPLALGQPTGMHTVESVGFHSVGQPFDAPFPASGMLGRERAGRIQYTFADKEYILDDPAVLMGAYVDVGLSGGPVCDVESRVAIGVVVAKLNHAKLDRTAFAIAFDATTLARSADLMQLFDVNRAEVAAGGAYLNEPGLDQLTRQATKQAIDRLIAQELFLPEVFVPRQAAISLVESFHGVAVTSDKRLLPLIGDSGTGKTTLLAYLSHLLDPALFLRAVTAPDNAKSLLDIIFKVLTAAETTPGVAAPVSPASLERAIAARRRPMLVLLDGINEFPDPLLARLHTWAGETVADLASGGLQLVFTSRPEIWSSVKSAFPARVLLLNERVPEPGTSEAKGRSDRSSVPYEVNDFDEQEFQQALALYKLPSAAINQDATTFLRHPLMCRLAAASQFQDRVDLMQLLEEFVTRKCAAVAQSGSATKLNVSTIRTFVDDLATRLLESGQSALATSELRAITRDTAVADAMVREHLLVEAGNRVRFALDEVSEYLQGSAVRSDIADAEHPLSLEQLMNRGDAMAAGAIAYCLARLDSQVATGGRHAADAAVERVLAIATRSANPSASITRLRSVLRHVRDLTAACATLRHLFALWAPEYARSLGHLLEILSSLPVSWRIDFAMMLVPSVEDDYGAETHHWEMLEYELRNATYEFDPLRASLRDWMIAEPAGVGLAVIGYLGDSTSFQSGHKSKLGDFAARVLFTFRDQLPIEVIVNLLFSDDADALLFELIRAIPERIVEAVTRLEERCDLQAVLAIVATAYRLRRHGHLGRFKDPFVRLLRPLVTHSDARVRQTALVCLGGIDDERKRVLEALIHEYRAGGINAWEFSDFRATDFEIVVAEMEARQRAMGEHYDAFELQSFGRFIGKPTQELRLFEWYSDLLIRLPSAVKDIARFVEDRIRLRVAPENNEAFLRLCRQIIQMNNDSAIDCVIYACFDENSRQPDEFLDRVKRELLTDALPLGSAALIIQKRLQHDLDFADGLLFLRIFGPDGLAAQLKSHKSYPRWQRTIDRWINSGQLPAEPALLQSLKAP